MSRTSFDGVAVPATVQPASVQSNQGPLRHIAVLVAWPLVLLALNPEWAFSPPGTIDPWVYFGTFVNLPHHFTSFAGTYYLSRLSWILPGYVAYAIFPPVAANICLHLGVFYTATIGCYSCLRMTAGPRAALVVSLLLGTHEPFLNAVGWDYVDGAGIAYFFAALASATAAARTPRPLMWCAISGAFAASCVFTNLAWAALMPGYVVYLAVLTPRLSVKSYALRGLAIGAGALSVTMGCAFVNARLTGNYWFFLPSVDVALWLTSRPNPAQSPSYDWVWVMPWLGTASILLLISIARVWLIVKTRGSKESLAVQLLWLWSALAMLAIEITGTPVLQLSYYASYLIPGMALAAGDLIAGALQLASSRIFRSSVGVGAAMSLSAFVSPAVNLFGATFEFLDAVVLGLFTAIVLRFFSTRAWSLAAGILCIFLLPVGYEQVTSAPGERLRNFELTVAAIEQIKPFQSEKPFYFWYSEQAPHPYFSAYTSIASSYLWGYRLFSAKYPTRTTPSGTTNQPRSGQRIALLTHDRPSVEDVEERLGANIRVVHEALIARRDIAFNLLIFDVR